MKKIFSAGDRIGGYCNGYFGRGDYSDKVCIFSNEYFAVFQRDDGRGVVLNLDDLADELKNTPFNSNDNIWSDWLVSTHSEYAY